MNLATSLNVNGLPEGDGQNEPMTDDLWARLTARLYKKDPNRKRPEARYKLNGIPTSTPGNISTYSAQSKVGKTAAMGALVASTYAVPGSDCLGFESSNPNGHAVIVFDTEQSIFDHAEGFERALRRAQVANAPPWVLSYCLTGFLAGDIRCAIRLALERGKQKFGGVHSFILDGVADVCLDVNNAEEANNLVSELHGLAIEFDCSLVCIIHVNPGSQDHKTRGHLGSQLERKSECNFKLERSEETTVIYADKNRRAPIPKDKGAYFAWNDDAGMHMSVAGQEGFGDRKDRVDLTELANSIFCGRPSMRYCDLITTVKTITGKSTKTAERKVTRMTNLQIITKNDANLYIKAV